MKKVIGIILTLSMLFALAACGAPANSPQPAATTAAPATTAAATTAAAETTAAAAEATTAAATTAAATKAAAATVAAATTAAAAADEASEAAIASFPGKIAIVTNTVDQNEEEYRSAEALQLKYGEDKIVHRTWPVNFSTEGEQMITVLQQLAADREIKGLIINQAVINTNAAVDKFQEIRDDVFVAYCTPAENPPDVAIRANLVISVNDPAMAEPMVMQAISQGAEVFAHYSFPRHMSVPTLAIRRDQIKEICEREGIRFVDLTAPDPTSDVGIPGAQQFIFEDVPKQVAELGKNTAFFSTNCAMQIPLITRVVDEGAIYPQPCCPSPYHGFPSALGIEDRVPTGEFDEDGEEILRLRDLSEVVEETRAILAQRGVAGRLSTWPVPTSMMWTTACAEYAIKWINGEVPKTGVDYDVFSELAAQYTMEVTGDYIGIAIEPLTLDDVTYDNYIMALMDYLNY